MAVKNSESVLALHCDLVYCYLMYFVFLCATAGQNGFEQGSLCLHLTSRNGSEDRLIQ